MNPPNAVNNYYFCLFAFNQDAICINIPLPTTSTKSLADIRGLGRGKNSANFENIFSKETAPAPWEGLRYLTKRKSSLLQHFRFTRHSTAGSLFGSYCNLMSLTRAIVSYVYNGDEPQAMSGFTVSGRTGVGVLTFHSTKRGLPLKSLPKEY